jgi:predicted ArsR family transcriptional regulator
VAGYTLVVALLLDTKRRIVERLKRVESATAGDLAAEFGLTDTALRQHLDALEGAGLVTRSAAKPAGRGRPPVRWQLTAAAAADFPDRHGELAVDLLTSVRSAFGPRAIGRVLEARADQQVNAYAQSLSSTRTIADRVAKLAELRSDEGYLAEAHSDGRTMTLIEHHCPIRDAAAVCDGLCAAELDVFRRALGAQVTVTRTQHLLAGDRRCAYEITPSR